MHKGIIMKRGRRHYVVLTPEGSFLKVPKRIDAEVGQEITFEEEKKPLLSFMETPRKTAMVSGLVAAMVLLAVLLPLMWMPTDVHAETYVYIDLNPSLELGINKNRHVVELRALNATGEKLIQGLDWKGVPINQMVVMVLNRAREQGFLQPHERIVVSQVAKEKKNADISRQTLDEIKETIGGDPELNQSNVDLFTLSLPDTLKAEAEKAGLSPAKYAVWILAKRNGLDITMERLSTLSMSEVMELVDLTPILRNPPSEDKWEKWVMEEKQSEGTQTISGEDPDEKHLDDQLDSSVEERKQKDDGSEDGSDADEGKPSNNHSSGDSTKEEPTKVEPDPSQKDRDGGDSDPNHSEPDDPSDDPSDSDSEGSDRPYSTSEEQSTD